MHIIEKEGYKGNNWQIPEDANVQQQNKEIKM
jgi:hypothetical protein